MSILILFVPLIAAPAVMVAAEAEIVGEKLGYTANKATGHTVANTETSVDIPVKGSQVMADAMNRGSEFSLKKGDVTATFKRGLDGRLMVHMSGKNVSDIELRAMGEELVGRMTQKFAYKKVMDEMKKRGFTVTEEEVQQDNTIRIKVSKYV